MTNFYRNYEALTRLKARSPGTLVIIPANSADYPPYIIGEGFRHVEYREDSRFDCWSGSDYCGPACADTAFLFLTKAEDLSPLPPLVNAGLKYEI
jgi:hypothetical protein